MMALIHKSLFELVFLIWCINQMFIRVGKLLLTFTNSLQMIINFYDTFTIDADEPVFTIISECASPNNVLTFECSAEIPVSSIVWQGTAFDCPTTNSEIVILTNRFDINISHSCSNGSIVGWNVVKPNDSSINTYTSRLNITISSDGKTVTCGYDNGTMQNLGSIRLIKTGMQLYPIKLIVSLLNE